MAELLSKINNPNDLKKLGRGDLAVLAGEIREKIITTVGRTGGHLASNLGVVELTIALYYALDLDKDKVVWDVGHQIYTHKLLTGRVEAFKTLRQYKGLSGFPKKEESPYDLMTSGHSSTAPSAALGIVCARDLMKTKEKVVAVIGDASLMGGMAFEGLNNIGHLQKNVIVILNDNEMGISKSVGALSNYLNRIITTQMYNRFKKDVEFLLKKVPAIGPKMVQLAKRIEESLKSLLVPGMLFEELGFRYIGPIDGHNLPVMIDTFQKILKLDGKPILVHVLTKKGKGYKFAEKKPWKFHSTPPFDIKTGNSVKTGKLTYTDVFGETLCELARGNRKIIAISAGMPHGTGLDKFSTEFPERFFDTGISEQHTVGFAAGLTLKEFQPVVAIYSTFLQRAYDQIFHEICLQKAPVILAIDRAGIVGEDGPTHHGLFDFAYLRSLPGMVVSSPKDGEELRGMLKTALASKGPMAIRYPRDFTPEEKLSAGIKPVPIGKGEILRQGKAGLILSIGSMVYPSLEAAEDLAGEGISVEVINARFVKPLDESLIVEAVKRNKNVLIVEEHSFIGGLGSAVLELLGGQNEEGMKVSRLAMPDKFIEAGKREEILELYGLTGTGIVRKFKECLNR